MPDTRSPRLLRLMDSVPNGAKAMSFLAEPAQEAGLLDASQRGLPAVCGISAELYARFGEASRMPQFKQFIGLAIRHIMESQHGYVLTDRGVKVTGDPVFSSGSRYRPRASAPRQAPSALRPSTARPNLVVRLVTILEDDELLELATMLPQELERRGINN